MTLGDKPLKRTFLHFYSRLLSKNASFNTTRPFISSFRSCRDGKQFPSAL